MKKTDVFIIILLVLFSSVYLCFSVIYLQRFYDLVNFNDFSYVAKNVLFDGNSFLSVNKDIANVVPTASLPLCYPPGLYFITKIISLIKDNQLTMHVFIFLLQIISLVFGYISLRKVSNRLISISFTLFLIFYTLKIIVVVDTFIQPLLALVVFLLVFDRGRNKSFNLFLLGIFTGIIFFIRQNTGLFLTNVVTSWILISCLETKEREKVKNRGFLWIITVIFLILGCIMAKIIHSYDDKIWYLLGYMLFWAGFMYYLYQQKKINLNIYAVVKRIVLFSLPLMVILMSWFYFFGRIVGIKKYLYIQFLMPFEFMKVYEYPISFHLNIAYTNLLSGIAQGSAGSIARGFITFMEWGILFIIPFACCLFCVIYMLVRIIRKKPVSIMDLQMASLPVTGILMFYPVESLSIVTTKLLVFLIPLAYFFTKAFQENKKALYSISILAVLVSFPFIFLRTGKNIYNFFSGRYANYVSLKGDTDVRIPQDIAMEVRKTINLIKHTIGESKLYIFDSYTLSEAYYGLTSYKHRNYYIFIRGDTICSKAAKNLLEMLKGYPFVLIGQKDYLLYTSNDALYLSGGEIGRSIPNELMEYVTKKYKIVASYDKPNNINDDFLSDFYILKKIE